MNYVVIPDNSKDHKAANYADASGKFYIIRETKSDKQVVKGGAILTSDISMYTILPAIVAQKAAKLQYAKNNAIQKLQDKLDSKLKSGVAVNNQKSFLGDAPSLVLPASESARVSFTQGLTLLNTAESLAPDVNLFKNAKISDVFGRGVVDSQNNTHDMTTTQFKQVVVTYGAIIGAMQGELMSQIAKVNAATSIEDVNKLVPKDEKKKKKDK